jgi:N-acetylglucosamine repressor
MNLHGQIIAEFQTVIATGNDRIAVQISEAIERCLEQVPSMEVELIKGIGVSSPGIIDSAGENVVFSSYLQLSQFRIKDHIAEAFPGVPVQVMNDSNAAAFAEVYSGSAKDRSNVIYFTINEGIGSGLIIDSQMYTGYQGAAGEIGHIPVDPDGEVCTCGSRGCIETVLTSPFILRKCQQTAKAQEVTVPVTFEEVIARYEAGEEWLLPIFAKIEYITTFMIASATNFVNPEVIIIEGWMNQSPSLMRRMKIAVAAFPFPVPFDSSRVLPASYGNKGSLYGAATLMLQQIFSASVLK